MPGETKKGASGGAARAKKLSPEERKSIASEAAKRRWAEVKRKKAEAVTEAAPPESPEPAPEDTGPKHCPACMNGQSLEEGEGTHILATVEHPVVLPAAFQDADESVAAATPVARSTKLTPAEKGRKRAAKQRAVPKVYGQALATAEKDYAQAAEELAYHEEMAARLKSKLPRLIQTIRALGGTIDPQAEQAYPNPAYNPNGGVPYMPSQPPQLPPRYPEYAQPQPVTAVVEMPKPMRSGGAGALDFGFLAND